MDYEGQKSELEPVENIVPVPDLSTTTSIEDVKIESNGCITHGDGSSEDNLDPNKLKEEGEELNSNDDENVELCSGYDLNTNGNGSSEDNLDPNKLKEEGEELNSNDDENVELCYGYDSIHSNRSTSGDYVDAVALVGPVEKGAENDVDAADSCVSPPVGMSPPSSGGKGKGLRKWRRIRREFVKDGSLSKDSAKILKRGSADLANPQKSDGSESSVNAEAFPVDGFTTSGYKLADSSTLSAAMGSDEDRNSRPSTAASIPKSRHDIPRPSGRDRLKTKPTSVKNSVNASQRMQEGLGNVDASKKPRGEAIKLDNDNLLSSPDSDTGSYSSAFMHYPFDGINNGQSDRGAVGEQESVEQLPIGFSTSVEDEDISPALSWENRGRDKNHEISRNWDPLVHCVQMLQSTQDALEQELQKFGEIGKDLRPFDDDSIRTTRAGPGFCVASSSAFRTSEEFGPEIPDSLKAKLISLTKNAEILEKQAAQAKGMLKEKETKIAELEAMINNLKSSNEDLGRNIDVQLKKYKEIEAEGDALFMLKMEADIQYLAVADMSIAAENRMKLLLTEQKFLVSAQEQEMNKVANLERRAANLEHKAEAGLTSGKGTVGAEMKQKKISKLTFCFCMQLVLFIFVSEFFISKYLPKTTVVLPT